jgi:hypothetical protein
MLHIRIALVIIIVEQFVTILEWVLARAFQRSPVSLTEVIRVGVITWTLNGVVWVSPSPSGVVASSAVADAVSLSLGQTSILPPVAIR